jgi:phosphatidylserine/phosphatidylglycerophosphate/cardiolipin synthase-like enzyme
MRAPRGCTSRVTVSTLMSDAAGLAIAGELLVQAYYFSSPKIIDALAKAKERGVSVEVILNKVNEPDHGKRVSNKRINKATAHHQDHSNGATYLLSRCVRILTDDKPPIAHNKVIDVDAH